VLSEVESGIGIMDNRVEDKVAEGGGIWNENMCET
jgi:hypothetical protein